MTLYDYLISKVKEGKEVIVKEKTLDDLNIFLLRENLLLVEFDGKHYVEDFTELNEKDALIGVIDDTDSDYVRIYIFPSDLRMWWSIYIDAKVKLVIQRIETLLQA